MNDDPIDVLFPEDRAWLRAHGWKEPPPQPHWVDGDFVVQCRTCGTPLSVEYFELVILSRDEPVARRAAEPVEGVLERPAPDCAGGPS